MHIKSPLPLWQPSPDLALWWEPEDVKALVAATRAIPRSRPQAWEFDLTAPVFARLCQAQGDDDGDPRAQIARITFDQTGFYIKALCPHCGAFHHHGVNTFLRFGHHRVADCGRGGYVLTVGVA